MNDHDKLGIITRAQMQLQLNHIGMQKTGQMGRR